MPNFIDMHLHTNVSDGADTALELYEIVKASSVHTFSVTDHDIMDATLEMEQLVQPSDNLHFIRGIEFSCITPVKKCHILGYDFDPTNQIFLDTYNFGIRLRQEKTLKRIDYWKNERGIILTEEETNWLMSQKSPGRPTFGSIILERGLVPDMATAIREYVTPCKVGQDRIDAAVAINAIRQAGGVTVWAHPLGGEGEKRLTREEFYSQLEILMESGIQGLECFYSRYSKEDIDFLIEQAQKHNLFITAGSDFHGKNKPNLHVGKLNEEDVDIDTTGLKMYP